VEDVIYVIYVGFGREPTSWHDPADRAAPMKLTAGLLAVVVLVTGGCGVGRERDDDIKAAAAGTFAAMGVPEEARVEFEYEKTTNPGCASSLRLESGLGEGEAWYARRAYAAAEGDYDYPVVIEAAAAHLEREGWQVQRYTSRPPRPGSSPSAATWD
jgi:predicted alpha/beta-hydrolase family hydrolase